MGLNPRPPNNTPIISATNASAFKKFLERTGSGMWKRAFSMDGVHSQYGAVAVARMFQRATDWVHDMQATGDIASNPNAAFQTITEGAGVIPDGWTLADVSALPFIEKITDGNYGPNAVRVSAPAGGPAIIVTFQSPLIPIHPDWIYIFETACRVSATGCAFQVDARYFDRDGVFLGIATPGTANHIFEYQVGVHALNEWHDRIDNPALIGAPPEEPTARAEAEGFTTARFAQISVGITAAAGETTDMDWGRIHRVADATAGFLDVNTNTVGANLARRMPFNVLVIDRSASWAFSTSAVWPAPANTNEWIASYDMLIHAGVWGTTSGGPSEVSVYILLNDAIIRRGIGGGRSSSLDVQFQVVKGDKVTFALAHNNFGFLENLAGSVTQPTAHYFINEVPTW